MSWEGEERRCGKPSSGDTNAAREEARDARDIAIKGLHLVESHIKECATLQLRIEKQQDEIKANQKDIGAEVTEINVRQATMATTQKAVVRAQEDLSDKLDAAKTDLTSKFDTFNGRLTKVEVRITCIVAAFMTILKLAEHYL